nr:MAG TPA: hypothetical protein [Caudoviricetes sp.]
MDKIPETSFHVFIFNSSFLHKLILPKPWNLIKGKRARRGRQRLCKLPKCPDAANNLV